MEDRRKFALFVLYVPPNQKADITKQMMSCLADGIEKVKLDLKDPYIVIGGDLNRRELSAIADFPDIQWWYKKWSQLGRNCHQHRWRHCRDN